MERKKADIIIIGSLSAVSAIGGGGKGGDLFLCETEAQAYETFDTLDAAVIRGDVRVDTFDYGGLSVVVCGQVSCRGGQDE